MDYEQKYKELRKYLIDKCECVINVDMKGKEDYGKLKKATLLHFAGILKKIELLDENDFE